MSNGYLSLLDENIYAQVVEMGPKRNASKLTVAKLVVKFLAEQVDNPTVAEKIEVTGEPTFFVVTVPALAQTMFGADARPEVTRIGSLVHSLGFHTYRRDHVNMLAFNADQIKILKNALNV